MYSRAQFYAKKGDPIFLLKVVYNRSIEEKKPIACPANGFVRPLPNTNDLYSLGEPYGEVTPIDHKIVDPETLFLFAFYYDTYFEASFSLIDQVTTYNDVAHKTPTAAARVAVKDLFGDKSLNGRDFWRYIDPKTKEEKRLGSHPTYAKS